MDESEERRVEEAARHVRSAGVSGQPIGVVLGSGLGPFAGRLSDARAVPYTEIPHMPSSTVPGHAGTLHFGKLGAAAVVCLSGRAHAYEGHAPARVVFGVRMLAELGCKIVLLTNAAGGIASHLAPGRLMLIGDHLNLTGTNPLVGPAGTKGVRFPDMTVAYDERLRTLAKSAAQERGIALAEGVYAALLGPSYETPAEIRMLRALGADAVGMSTVPEVIALRALGVRVGAISLITNYAAGISPVPLSHEEVQQTAALARESFGDLLARWIELAQREVSA